MPMMRDSATVTSYETAEAGLYLSCRFLECKPDRKPSFDDKNVMEDIYRWTFETTDPGDMNSEGKPFRFTRDTGRKFGDDRAKLTILMDQMVGRRLTVDEFLDLDTDTLKPTPYDITVDAKPSSSGKVYNNITAISRSRRTRSQGPPVAQGNPPQATARPTTPPVAPPQRNIPNPAPVPPPRRQGSPVPNSSAELGDPLAGDDEFSDPFDE